MVTAKSARTNAVASDADSFSRKRFSRKRPYGCYRQNPVVSSVFRLYGWSSEKIDPKQMALSAEMLKVLDAQNPPTEPKPTPAAPPVAAPRKGHGRRRIPAALPRERRIHDLLEEEKPCPCCGTMREVIGQEVSEQLDIEPAIRLLYDVESQAWEQFQKQHKDAAAAGPVNQPGLLRPFFHVAELTL